MDGRLLVGEWKRKGNKGWEKGKEKEMRDGEKEKGIMIM